MVIYSHSRLSTFEQCPKKFQFKYLDKIIPPIEKSIETHLGKCVHETLEWLYKEVKDNKRVPSLDEVLEDYTQRWENRWEDGIKIVNHILTKKDYFNKGIRFLLEYYMKHKPFEDNTIGIEERIFIELDEDGKYKLQGFIDRLVYNLETGEYEVHDYKTSNNLPNTEKIENDRQLALYSIAVKEKFGKDKDVSLIWHYLAFNRKIESKRTNEQLEKLKKETIELIDRIETAENFPTKKSTLCSWCEYKPICPAWNEYVPKTKEEAEKILREVYEKEKGA
jgi:putative RecB family exonuclease